MTNSTNTPYPSDLLSAPLTIDGTIGRGSFLQPVALHVQAGETVLVRGRNGTGKTTLLRTIAGLEQLHAGQIHIGERLIDDATPTAFVAPHLRPTAMAFQEPRLFAHMSVAKNVAFGMPDTSVHSPEFWLKLVDLNDFADAAPGDLSGGQAQRVGLARALATEPAILLVDEPLSAVDDSIRNDLRELIALQPATTIWVSHGSPDALPTVSQTFTLPG